jgi:hypothetical protein
MNHLKISAIILLVLVLSTSLIACKKKKENTTTTTSSGGGSTTSAPTPTTGVSVANITVTTGSVTTTLTGPCGWAVAGGVNYIGANDQTLTQRAFAINFNIPNPPSQTTTYSIVASASNNGTSANIVDMSFAEIAGNSSLAWNSTNSSGSVTLVVSGNKVTVNLAGITLTAQTNSGFFTNLNVGELAKPGVLSGTLVFYK